jgi:hypothetical protein
LLCVGGNGKDVNLTSCWDISVIWKLIVYSAQFLAISNLKNAVNAMVHHSLPVYPVICHEIMFGTVCK